MTFGIPISSWSAADLRSSASRTSPTARRTIGRSRLIYCTSLESRNCRCRALQRRPGAVTDLTLGHLDVACTTPRAARAERSRPHVPALDSARRQRQPEPERHHRDRDRHRRPRCRQLGDDRLAARRLGHAIRCHEADAELRRCDVSVRDDVGADARLGLVAMRRVADRRVGAHHAHESHRRRCVQDACRSLVEHVDRQRRRRRLQHLPRRFLVRLGRAGHHLQRQLGDTRLDPQLSSTGSRRGAQCVAEVEHLDRDHADRCCPLPRRLRDG